VARLGTQVVADAEVIRLASSASPKHIQQTVAINTTWNYDYSYWKWVNVPLRGPEETSVYKVVVTFRNGWGVQVGRVVDPYFTTTDGTSAVSQARTKILLSAFKELGDSDAGLVGYAGQSAIDGTRYNTPFGRNWCSEFYAWNARNVLKYMTAADEVQDLVNGFMAGSSYSAGTSNVLSLGRRGEYLPIENSSENDGPDHSGMLLAVDTSVSPTKVWSIEGNVGNTVDVKERTDTSGFVGVGRITDSMLQS
jgi:hypothetical protein